MPQKNTKEQVNLGLRKFIKDLGYVAGGTALLATTPWLQSFTTDKLDDIKKEKVTPRGSPALVNPINKGIDEHEQNGVTVPNKAATILALTPLNLEIIFLLLSGGKKL